VTGRTRFYDLRHAAASLLSCIDARPEVVQDDVFTNFGRLDQQHKSLTLRLTDKKDTVPIGKIEF